MIRTPLEDLITKVDSRYTLVVMTAKRARQIMDFQQKRGDYGLEKPVTRAMREIQEGKVTYYRPSLDDASAPWDHADYAKHARAGANQG
ncbi:MAG: DNA-directed RNA polymerase subunit omega [Clostridia bacterium]|nr:DNA-directed RNA polymerase subunit omega [Clostridia bacterium]